MNKPRCRSAMGVWRLWTPLLIRMAHAFPCSGSGFTEAIVWNIAVDAAGNLNFNANSAGGRWRVNRGPDLPQFADRSPRSNPPPSA